MERHRKSVAAAAKDTASLSDETNAATGVFGKLRGMLAGLFSVFSVATLIRGIRSIVTESSNSEQALGQLEAALASTGTQAGLSANELLRMADSLRETSNFSTEQIVSAETRLLSYTSILRSEFPRALQITIDQAQRLGISVESSAEIIGKALQSPAEAMTTLARQGFRLEEGQKSLLKQMVATGRTAEAQTVIMDMLAESYGGAAQAARLGRLAGLWKGLSDRIGDFYTRVANSGFVDHLRSRLEALQSTIGRMAEDGRLDEWARSISNTLVSVARAIEGTIRFVANYSQAIVSLGKAYALLKVSAVLDGLARVASGATKASVAVQLLSKLILGIPAIRIAVIGGAAIALAADHVRDLGQAIGSTLPETKKWEARLAALRAEIVAGSERFRVASEALSEFAGTQVKTAAEVAKLTDAERASYAERVAGLQEYLRLQIKYYEQLKDAEALNADGLAHLDALRERLASAAKGYGDIAAGAKLAAAALDNDVTPAAQKLIGELESIGEKSSLARERLGEVFKNFENMDFTQLGDLALALQSIGEQSDATSNRVRDGLSTELAKLSGQDLQKFQMAATAAFDETGRSGDRAAVVLGTTLQVAMERLGVSVSRTGVAISDAGKNAIATFRVVAENAQATSRQVEEAFKAALGGAQTRQEVDALAAALESAGDRGRISIEGTERATLALQRRMRELRAEIDPLADEFDVLGIKSQASLIAVRDSAREAFEAIVEGAREGKAAREDVVRALNAWADAERDAAAQSTASQQASVETLLSGRAASLGLSSALVAAGSAGKQAGDMTAAAMGGAADAIDAAAASAAAMAEANARAAESADRTSQSITNITLLTEEQRSALRMLGQDWMAGRRSAQEYAEEVQAAMSSATESIEDQIEAAERATQALRDMRAELQDDADRAAGNEEAIEKRRYEERLREIKELEAAGGAAAQREAAEVRRLAEQEHRRRLAEIRERARAEREERRASADESAGAQSQAQQSDGRTPASGGGSTGAGQPLVIHLPTGQPISLLASDRAAADRLIEYLRQAAAASGRGGSLL
ncbi:MAG TPA: phage tail length tape measure family protein [Dokdonella sp.]|uniref:phage tail length tape measure family protein n=1 Tax=Dokdonella sp. TaxID=2291710 RepID=UPI002C71D037|nr:phage tail length tape measure family protein [Dokdonella sp.]HUD43538.1 phage tail length tape measure family protein [Dokdonella sp.]